MSEQSVSTSVKVRFSREFLTFVEAWGAKRGLPRSRAIRVLMFKGLEDDWSDWKCDCSGTDQCTGRCNQA